MNILRLVLLALCITALPARSAVFTVTKTADTLDGACDHDCSLREAVAAANAFEFEEVEDMVVVPPGIYLLTRTGAGEDESALGDLDLDDEIILVGAGPGSTILDGFGSDRVLDVRAPAEIFGVTIRNGRVDGDGGGLLVRPGLGNRTTLLHRSVVSGNQARHGGDGGGIAALSSMEVHDSAVLENLAEGWGGGIAAGRDARLHVRNVTVSGNLAHGSGGGIFYTTGATAISGSTVAFNQAHVSGGGLAGRYGFFQPEVVPDVHGSIVAQNTAPAGPDCGTDIFSHGYNLIGAGEGCYLQPTDRSGTAAQPLRAVSETLAGGLGPTPVHVLLEGSPALDLVPQTHCEPSDQAGQARTAPCDAGAWERVAHPVCVPGGAVLCLQEGRFRVTAAWQLAGQTRATPAQAVPLTGDTGAFWFFQPENLEITVKVLNGCSLNQRWWVFSSGLTDVGAALEVEDLATGRVWSYIHPPGRTYPPRLDTGALECSPPPASAAFEQPPPVIPERRSRALPVTKTADTADGRCDHDCSLREAVIAANAEPDLNVIVLGQGVHALAIQGAGEDAAAAGDLDVTRALVILGAGAKRTVLDGGGHDRVLDVHKGGSLELHGVAVRNGWARPDGATLPAGGGVRALARLRVVRSWIASNRADGAGGGLYALDGLAVRDSTISGNASGNQGGGLYAPSAELENVTVSGNRAEDYGGGFLFAAGDASLRHVTVAGNAARFGGGLAVYSEEECPSGVGFGCGPSLEMQGTVIAGNAGDSGAADCFDLPGHAGGENLFGIGNVCRPGPTDRAGTPDRPLAPGLTPLGDHGGPTPTHVPLAGSPAVDLAPPASCPAADQRGRPRPSGKGCDAGAAEIQPGCQPDERTLCLGAGDRFRVTVSWERLGDGHSGSGRTLPLALDTGAFWFFEADNLELTVKVLDGCAVNGRFWVFLSGLTDLRVDVRVEDTQTGEVWTHRHAAGTPLQPRLDTNALNACPAS